MWRSALHEGNGEDGRNSFSANVPEDTGRSQRPRSHEYQRLDICDLATKSSRRSSPEDRQPDVSHATPPTSWPSCLTWPALIQIRPERFVGMDRSGSDPSTTPKKKRRQMVAMSLGKLDNSALSFN